MRLLFAPTERDILRTAWNEIVQTKENNLPEVRETQILDEDHRHQGY